MLENTAPGLEQQLVYRIDCDKHSTLGGAPPILVLQKDSVQPPILILSGMQTNPPRSPVIKDERRNKSQGYIVQDERKPPPPTPPVNAQATHSGTGALPYMTTGLGETNYSPYQQPNGLTDSSTPHDPSYFGPRTPSGYPDNGTSNNTSWAFGQQQQQQQQVPLHSPYLSNGSDGSLTPGGGFGPYHRRGPWAAQQPSSFGLGGEGRASSAAATPTLPYTSSGRPPYNNGMMAYHQPETDPYQHQWHSNNNGMDNQQQHQPPLPSPFFHQRPAHLPPPTVQQPTVIHGDSRRSRSCLLHLSQTMWSPNLFPVLYLIHAF